MAVENILVEPRSLNTPMSHYDAVHLHQQNNVPIKFNSMHFSEIQPGEDFKGQDHKCKVKGHIKVKS